MSFKAKLADKTDLVQKDKAKEFAELMKPKLIGSAEKGYNAFRIEIDDFINKEYEPYVRLFYNKNFRTEVTFQLDEVVVTLERERKIMGYVNYLLFKW